MKLTQPDRRSCGAAALVMARRMLQPDYAVRTRDQESFAREVTGVHHRVTSPVGLRGNLQVPWLRSIGTPPWAASREMRALTGTPYRVHTTRRRGEAWELLQHVSRSHPMIAYIGDTWTPRHVVLVLDRVGDAVWSYEPAAGHAIPVSRSRWSQGPLRLAGWDQPWFVCAPR